VPRIGYSCGPPLISDARHLMRVFSLLLLSFLAGCTAMPADAPQLDSQALANLGIEAADVQQRESSFFGVTSTESRVADFRPSHVLLTRSSIEFITLNGADNTYRKALSLPLSRVQTAALVHYGNMGHLRQIHITSDLALVVMSFSLGETERAEKFFEILKGTGLRVAEGTGYVRSASASPAVIPIFIPLR
jgi:hypothetical protein